MGNNQSSGSIQFQIKIKQHLLNFLFQNGILQITGYTSLIKAPQYLMYDASYEDISLPEDITNKFKSLQNFCKNLQSFKKELSLQGNNLSLKIENQKFYLPLMFQNQTKILEGDINDLNVNKWVNHKIQLVKNPKQYPYNAVVKIFATNQDKTVNVTGSGVLTDKNTVLTVAHNVFQREKFQAKHIQIYVQTKKGQEQIRVKNHFFPSEYKTKNLTDMHKYDFAYLELQPNNIIQDSQILQTKWNITDNQTKFQVIGYSSKVDTHAQIKKEGCYHLKCDKFIQLLQNHAEYPQKAAPGVSGGPLIIQQDGKFKVIGLHQCAKANMSQAVLLTEFGKSPKQILDQLNQQKQSPTHKKPHKIKGSQLYKQAEKELHDKKYDSALDLFKQYLVIAKQNPGINSIEYADTLHQIGRINFYKSNHEQALKNCKESLKIKQKVIDKKHEKYTKSLIGIGGIYDKQGDFKNALAYYNNAKQIFQSIKPTDLGQRSKDYGRTLINIGVIYSKNAQYSQALKCYEVAQKLYESIIGKANSNYTLLLTNMGTVYQKQLQYKKALGYYSVCAKIMKSLNKTSDQNYQICKINAQNMEKKLV